MSISNLFSSHPYQISFENVSWLNSYNPGPTFHWSQPKNPFSGCSKLNSIYNIWLHLHDGVHRGMGFLPKCRLYTFLFLKIHFIVLNTVEGRPPSTKLGALCVVWVNCVPDEYSTVNIGVWLMTWVVRLLIYFAYFSSDYEKRKCKAVGCERNDFWNAVWCRFL